MESGKEVKMGDTVEEEEEAKFSEDPPNPNPESERETLIFNNNNNHTELLKAIEVVERDSFAIAQSFTSVFASLRLSLSQSTDTSLHHIQCFTDAAGHLQESGIHSFLFIFSNNFQIMEYLFISSFVSVLDAATKGNRYINSCLK
jgi:hypothetical protein